MSNAGLYLHIPFCRAKCAYCDFCSFPHREDAHARYIEALLCEVESQKKLWAQFHYDTLYIGGGTPTNLDTALLVQLLTTLLSGIQPDEITIEANPGTVDESSLRALRQVGVNRLSLGVQSMNDDELATMGRIHNAVQAIEAISAARLAGFDNISLDLIYGLPGQTLHTWECTLDAVVQLHPSHLSLYALTLEEHVPMAQRIAQGDLPKLDEALAADMYALAQERLAKAGYAQYEISNWALAVTGDADKRFPRLASRHNLHYWHNEPYLGLGAAAYSFDGHRRWGNTTDLDTYMENALRGEPCIDASEELAAEEHMDETVILALRLVDGLEYAEFEQRFGLDLKKVYDQAIAASVEDGLLEQDERGIRLKPQALLVGNRVFERFLRD